MSSAGPRQHALSILHYLLPVLILTYYAIAQCVAMCSVQTPKHHSRRVHHRLLLAFHIGILGLYSTEAVMLLTDSFANSGRYSSEDSNIYALLQMLTWTILTASLAETKVLASWYPLYGCWGLNIPTEIVVGSLDLPVGHPGSFQLIRCTVQGLRLVMLVLLPAFFFYPTLIVSNDSPDLESEPLLKSHASSDSVRSKVGVQYGSTRITTTTSSEESDGLEDESPFEAGYKKAKEQLHDRLQASGSWWAYVKRFRVFVPLVWPSGQRRPQLSIIGVVVIICADRALTLLLPRQLGLLVDSVSDAVAHETRLPGAELGLFLLFQYLSASRILDSLEELFWTPIEQHAEKSVKLAAHAKILDLSRDFQTEKSSAEILDSVSQGLSVTHLFREIVISIFPLAVDLFIAVVYLSSVFGSYMVMMFAATAIVYLWTTVHLESERSKTQRMMLETHRKESQALYESVGEWDTVSYFGRRAYEKYRLAARLDLRLAAEWKLTWFDAITNLVKEFTVQSCLAGACLLVFYQIMHGAQPIGSFVMLVYYFQNVMGYIKYLGYLRYYLSRCLVNAELLCDLLLKDTSVKDGPMRFRFIEGSVSFENISFSYDTQRKIVQGFNFQAPGGSKVALVGETGGGKSTILRLLFRFYDVQEGRICIDGQDIKEVSLDSFRHYLGVVPQDPSLFNMTVMENVRYARLEATDDEVIEACKSAAIHEKIMTYTHGYQTRVGEHGIILSGGEKQRVAIARVILKRAKIILLDEATSSVDSETERLIQTSLGQLTAGKTTFTIAHRLSTVKDADVILVIKDGAIVEQGSPSELLARDGRFSRLWKGQFDIQMHTHHAHKHSNAKHTNRSIPQGKSNGNRPNRERSASSFRADAPVFVPHSQQNTEADSGHVLPDYSGAHYESNHATGSKQVSDHKAVDQSQDTSAVSKQKAAQPSTAEVPRASADVKHPAPQHDGSADVSQTDDAQKKYPLRQNRRQRRKQSRSEGSVTLNAGQMDGPDDQDAGASLQTSQSTRRVSGPGHYPSGNTTAVTDETPSGRHPYRRRRFAKPRKPNETVGANLDGVSANDEAASQGPACPPQTAPYDNRRNFTVPNMTGSDESTATGAGHTKTHVKFASEH